MISTYHIGYDTTDVVGATEADPVVTITGPHAVDEVPARSYARLLVAYLPGLGLFIGHTTIFELPVHWGFWGRRRIYRVDEDQWLEWLKDQDYPARSQREQWVRNRNRAILDLIAHLLDTHQ